MIVVVVRFQVVVAPQWISVIIASVVCWSMELWVLANVLSHIVTYVLRVNIPSRGRNIACLHVIIVGWVVI